MINALLGLSLFALACGCRSIKPLPPLEARSYQSLLEWSQKCGMPGAVLLVQTPKTNFLASVGWADRKRKMEMRPNHAFRIGSVTKMFLGVAVAQLHTDGALDMDRTLTNYLPESITRHIENSDRITLRQLTRHTSGIYDFNDSFWYQLRRGVLDRRGKWPPLRELEYAYDKPAAFAPGKGWDYSNSNFLLLGLIVDDVTEGHHSQAIRTQILDRLSLTNTYYELSEPPRGGLARGYERHFGFLEDTTEWTPVVGGSAGMVSTAEDLATFVRAVAGTNTFLDADTRKLLRSQPRQGNTERPWYPVLGYDFGMNNAGWRHGVPVLVAPMFFGHAGGTSGYLCFAWHEPERDITIVYFGSSNLVDAFHRQRNAKFERLLETALFEMAIK